MFAGWSRLIVLVALAAFIGNANCLGNCAAAACKPAKGLSKGCHHHKQSNRDLAKCTHQHSEFTGPEAGLSKITLAATSTVPLIPHKSTVAVSLEPLARWFLDMGPPVHSLAGHSIPVLRI